MEIKMQRTKIGMIQTVKENNKNYYCLFEVLKAIGNIPTQLYNGKCKSIYVEGEVIYAHMQYFNHLLLTAFIEEEGFQKLIKGQCK